MSQLRAVVLASAVAAIATSAFACGGKVVFVEDGGEGASGPGGSGAGLSSSSVPGQSPCEALCAAGAGCVQPGCVGDCQLIYEQGCPAEADAFILCLAKTFNPDTCLADQCLAELGAYTACVGGGGGCGGVTCSSTDFDCDCTRSCEFEIQEASCKAGAPGDFECECLSNGASLGVCFGTGAGETACDLDFGCCSAFFAQGV